LRTLFQVPSNTKTTSALPPGAKENQCRKEAKVSGRPINSKPARLKPPLRLRNTAQAQAIRRIERSREARYAGRQLFKADSMTSATQAVVSATGGIASTVVSTGAGSRVFKRLDRYEGKHFKRRRLPVSISTGKKISAWVYLYCGEVRENKRIRSGDYVAFRRIR
jgi:gamma-glutamylcyclotransferase (GGCT)/AIG2-like uncharacterized protein YtfP